MAGRPPKLTPEVQTRIVEALSAGVPRTLACKVAGINYATFKRWMVKGAKPKGSKQFRAFCAIIKKTEAEIVESYCKTIKTASAKSWQAAAWWLERSHPGLFGMNREMINDLKKFLAEQKKRREEGATDDDADADQSGA